MSHRVADLVVDTLQAAGVRSCYGIVGDTLNRIAHAIDRSEIDWVHMRHEEAGAFAASAEALLTGRLTACAGTCGPGSLHFINGLYEANRNRAPVILIATQIVRQDLGFESIQEIDYEDVFKGCSVYCEIIVTPEQARRKTVAACQAALTKRGVAVLVVPADVANAVAHEEPPDAVHVRRPLVRPSDEDLDAIAAILNRSEAITIYAGAGCAGAHDEHGNTAFRQSCLAGCDCLATGLLRRHNHLAIDAAAPEHVVVIDLLDRFEPQVLPHDLGCNQNDGCVIAISFIEPVDEVETAGAAGSRAGRETPSERRFGCRREGAGLFMPDMDPIDLAAVDGVGNPVHRVADDPVARLHAGCLQRFDQQIGHSFTHSGASRVACPCP